MAILCLGIGFLAGMFLLILFSKKETRKFNALREEKVRLEKEKENVDSVNSKEVERDTDHRKV